METSMETMETRLREILSKLNKVENLDDLMKPTPNPSVPLNFEKYSDCTDPGVPMNPTLIAELDRIHSRKSLYLAQEITGLEEKSTKLMCKNRHAEVYKILKAYIAALKAYSSPDPIAAADTALAMYDIPEAYNVKAMFQSKNFEEALKWYSKTTEGIDILKEKTEDKEKFLISYFEYSSLRAILGKANCLRKLGRYAEAEKCYKRLKEELELKAGQQEHITQTRWLGPWFFHLPEVLMKQGKFKEANDLFLKEDCHALSLHPSICVMKWTQALLDYICNKNRGFDHKGFLLFLTQRENPNRDSIGAALSTSWIVLGFLTGREKFPNHKVPLHIEYGKNSWTVAAEYARAYLPLWQNTPGAIEWAVKNANTFSLCLMMSDDVTTFPAACVPRDDKTFKKLVKEGIFVNAKSPIETHLHLLHQALFASYKKTEILLKAGAKVSSDDPEFEDPLDVVICTDLDPRCIKLLIEHGCDPYADKEVTYESDGEQSVTQMSAVEKAAHMGHARHLHAIFSVRPPDPGTCVSVFSRLMCTECLPCLKGGETCKSCLMNQKHSPNASFEMCVIALLIAGYEQSEEMLSTIEYRLDHDPVCLTRNSSKPYIKEWLNFVKIQMKLSQEELLQIFENRYGRVLPYCEMCRSYDNLQKCSVCKFVYYCGSKCQKQDWKQHKVVCSRK